MIMIMIVIISHQNQKGIHLDRDTWIDPGQILTGKPPPGSGKQLQTSSCHMPPGNDGTSGSTTLTCQGDRPINYNSHIT